MYQNSNISLFGIIKSNQFKHRKNNVNCYFGEFIQTESQTNNDLL